MARHKNELTGQPLVADFQTVMVSASTIQAAQYEATRSENELLGHLEAISAGTYLNPGAINDQDDVTRASLDAHIKKVQAEQLDSINTAQLRALADKDQADYTGRKVRITVLKPILKPVETIWFDESSGYRTGGSKKTTITGTIEAVLLDKNFLLIRPGAASRFINSNLKNYVIHIIDPETCRPMVDIAIL